MTAIPLTLSRTQIILRSVLLACIVVTMLTLFVTVWRFGGSPVWPRILSVSAILTWQVTLILVAQRAYELGHLPRVMMAAMITGAAGTLLLIFVMLQQNAPVSRYPLVIRIGTTLCMISLALTLLASSQLRPTRHAVLDIARRISIISIWVGLAALVPFVWITPDDAVLNDTAFSIWIVLYWTVIVGLFGGLLLLSFTSILIRSTERMQMGMEHVLPKNPTLTFDCPHCQQRQTLPMGIQRCRNCRSELYLRLTEPRCECGQLLYNRQTDRCPECGRDVPESLVPVAAEA